MSKQVAFSQCLNFKKRKKYIYSNQIEWNIPIRKTKIFQLGKGKYSYQKKENVAIRKWKNICIRKIRIFELKKKDLSIRKSKIEKWKMVEE